MKKLIFSGLTIVLGSLGFVSNAYASYCPDKQVNSDGINVSVFVGAHIEPQNGGALNVPGSVTCEYGIGAVGHIANYAGVYLVSEPSNWTFNVRTKKYDCYKTRSEDCEFNKQ